MWLTTNAIALSPGYYWLYGYTGASPRAIVWNNSSCSTPITYIQNYKNADSSFTVLGNYYINIPILVSGVSSLKPYSYQYDLRKITFN